MNNTNIKNWCVALALAASAPMAAFASAGESALPQAQQATGNCTGTIFDETGEPLVGATVRVEGTTIAGSANIDGEFSLKGVRPGQKLVVNYIGYSPLTVVWNGQPLNIVLKEDSNLLDEVVVMGYGVEQKRSNVTNSIAKVSEKTLTVGTNANPAQALVGAISGVKVAVTSGSPSATPTITVRGGTNFDGGSNQPLVIVDGNIRDSMSDINPNDIEDMQILKDAGATALYGARAGNGVILITTKQGKSGQGRVTFSAKVGINDYNNQGYERVGTPDYLYYYRSGLTNSQWALAGGDYANQYTGLFTNTNAPFGTGRTTYEAWQNYNIVQLNDNTSWLKDYGWQQITDPLSDTELLYKDTNILKYNLNSPAITQDYNVSFAGGNDRGNYYASLGYYDAEGAVKSTFYKRYNFAMTGTYRLTNWLTSNSVFNYIRSNWLNDHPQINTAYMMNRGIFWNNVNFEGLQVEDDGSVSTIPMLGNNGPLNVNVNKGKFDRDYQADKFQMTQSLTAQIIEGLTLKGTMSWYYNEQLSESFNKNYAANNVQSYYLFYGDNKNVTNSHATSKSFLRYFDQTYNLVANFNRTFNEKHYVAAMAGMEFYKRTYKTFDAGGSNAPTEYFPNLDLTQNDGDVQSRTMSSAKYEESILSYFARLEYNYAERYLLAATFREDGYSRLIDNRWGFFPGVSAGWVFSNEDFFRGLNLDWINYGKIRASYGLNATINSNYLGYYNLAGVYSSYKYDGNVGYRISSLPNPKLRWERTRTFEVGLDLGFLQNRFNLGLTYYNRLTMDKYAALSLPRTTGFSSVTDNNGQYRNQGLEIDINATLLRLKDFQWTLGANLTYNTNSIVKLPENGLLNNRQGGVEVYSGNGDETKWIGGYQEGQNPYQQVGYKAVGMVRNQSDIDALGDYIDVATSYGQPVYATEAGRQRLIDMGYSASKMIRLVPGSYYFKDMNGDNKVDSKDQTIIGHRDPHWTGGFNTTLSWKGLSLYARFDMGFGFQVYDSNLSFWLAEGQGAMGFPSQAKETWEPTNPGAKYPRITWADQYGTDSYIRSSSAFAQNGNYLACRELSLSYQFPEKICKKFRSQGLSLSVTGQNLGYIKSCTIPLPDNTTYWYGNTAGNGGTYNLPRTVIFGLNVSF